MSFWKNKKILITGGAGFIGSNLAKDLLDNGAIVSLADNFERGKREYISELLGHKSLRVHKRDLRKIDDCLHITKDVEIVIHLASKVGGIGYYQSYPFQVLADNLAIDANIIKASISNGVSRFLYASSAHVYPLELQLQPDCPLISESQSFPCNPELSYGWAKLIGEKSLSFAVKENPNFRIAIARYVGIYGKNQDFGLDTGSVIPVFAHRALKYPSIPFSIWGNGEETRSYCFIEDAIDCTKRMIMKMEEQQIVGPLNIGKQELVKIKEIAEHMVEISEKDIKLEFDTSKKTTIWGQLCDCSKAFEVLGWEAKTSLKEGLKVVFEDVSKRI